MSQLADTFIELHKYPFDVLGSLDRPGESHVGALARESLTDFAQSDMRAIGPFSSLEEYHKSSLQLVLDLILRGEMYSNLAVNAYLIHRFLIDLIPSVLPESESEPESEPEPDTQKFYLKHADDKGDHILVDDDFHITGIIDWEWAHTAPPAHAFNSPIAFLPVADFYNGSNELGDDELAFARLFEEKGRRDLGRCVRRGRLQHRFAFCCGYDLAADWSGFQGLFQGLRDAVKVDEGMGWEDWKAVAMRRYGEEAGLQLLLSRGDL
ncbi:Putative aminoglycoside phosphotransferase, protein kinase-like domain superfamily [Colletotrichum destructivum]|uniref:Aminoglycoside phosphotransferase, protein kinase-like domain superfamily n=1 Tax=Colletotrichum destructivum TaxID=34406 RepID=A0AAX4IS66_9PEZI|nr:Putative aminoglycoside phosphotransferase, protein kinase-like domain superfamily [Colletotrichum destructivum]